MTPLRTEEVLAVQAENEQLRKENAEFRAKLNPPSKPIKNNFWKFWKNFDSFDKFAFVLCSSLAVFVVIFFLAVVDRGFSKPYCNRIDQTRDAMPWDLWHIWKYDRSPVTGIITLNERISNTTFRNKAEGKEFIKNWGLIDCDNVEFK